MTATNPLPRRLAPGVFWLGDCLEQRFQGQVLHSYDSVFLVAGDHASVIIEAGHPKDTSAIMGQLDQLVGDGVPPVRYLFATHQETPHAGGIGEILRRFPEAELCGDVRDYHLFLPDLKDRFRSLKVGDRLDLGNADFIIVEAAIKDLNSTLWGFDARRRVLFPGDGFSYSHYHAASHCGMLAEEVPGLPISDMTALFSHLALYWMRFVDIEPYIARLDQLLEDRQVELIAPTHGLPIGNVEATLPAIREGLRIGSKGMP